MALGSRRIQSRADEAAMLKWLWRKHLREYQLESAGTNVVFLQ